jgi:hypothetical protein
MVAVQWAVKAYPLFIQSSTAGITAEIRTQNLANISLKRYRYTNLFKQEDRCLC